jgi:hypothetical protein
MPDTRVGHHTLRYPGASILNVPTPPFNGAGASLYGPRGPQRASPDYAARKPLSTPPESLEHYIADSIARVAGLSGAQRRALQSELMRTCRDVGFIHCVTQQAHGQGPNSDAAAGVPMDQGRPL